MLNIKFIYVSYTPQMQDLKVMLYNIFQNFMYETVTIKFSTYGIILPFKEFQVLEHFVFNFMDFVFLNYGFSTIRR